MPSSVELFALFFVLLGTIFLWKKYYPYNRYPSFPGRSLFFGHINLAKDCKAGWATLVNGLNQKLQAPAAYIHFGRRHLVVMDLQLVKEIFVTNGATSSERNPSFGRNLLMKHYKKLGVASNNGATWKHNRVLFLQHMRLIGQDRLQAIIEVESGYLVDELVDKSPFDPSEILQKAVSNIISTLIFDDRFEYDDEEFSVIMHSVVTLNNRFFQGPYILQLLNHYVDLFPGLTARRNALEKVVTAFKKKIYARVSEGTRDPPETLIDAYMSDMDQKGKMSVDKQVENLITVIYELFFAGTETTSSTLLWALACLAANPQVQTKVQQEIDGTLRDGDLSLESISKMDYFLATLCEIQRFGSIALTSIGHEVKENLTLSDGKVITVGETINAGIHNLHTNPKHWRFPDEFQPDNFLDESGHLVKNEAFMPYGIGPRICLGKKVADLELKVFLICLLQKCSISTDEEIDLTCRVTGVTSAPGKKYRYVFTPRETYTKTE